MYLKIYVIFFPDINSKTCVTKSDKDISFSKTQEKPAQLKRFGANWKFNDDNCRKTFKLQRYPCSSTDPDLLCGVIFVDKCFTAKVLFYLLSVNMSLIAIALNYCLNKCGFKYQICRKYVNMTKICIFYHLFIQLKELTTVLVIREI